jgi:hypothetical protein
MREIASFIVRIYRRSGGHATGVVEDVQSGQVHPFHSSAELWLLLLARDPFTNPQGARNESHPKE